MPSGCLAVSKPTLGVSKSLTDWKQELRTEILNEVKEQRVWVPARGIVVVKDDIVGANKAILEMNVIADCWEELFNGKDSDFIRSRSPVFSKQWNSIFADCQRVHAAASNEKWQVTARLASRSTVTIPAQCETLVWTKIARNSSR